jgi:hypothetical protein
MLGGEFIRHDAQQAAQLIVTDSKFPGMAAIPPDYAPFEEWYSLKKFAHRFVRFARPRHA